LVPEIPPQSISILSRRNEISIIKGTVENSQSWLALLFDDTSHNISFATHSFANKPYIASYSIFSEFIFLHLDSNCSLQNYVSQKIANIVQSISSALRKKVIAQYL
jgi:hypothetical protein